MPEPDLPISLSQARVATRWLMTHFGDRIRAAVAGKVYGAEHLCAIVCQETAYFWISLIGVHDPATLVARCVLDASGDAPNAPRSAFPKNTAEFRASYGDAFTEMLIQEANLTRTMRGFSPKTWVYKGYGIFQYDLQFVKTDRAYFEERKWRSFDHCLDRVCGELDEKLAVSNGDLWLAIRKYNGSGPRAEQYRVNVQAFTPACLAEIQAATPG